MRECEFCHRPFRPIRRKQRTCGQTWCQHQRIADNQRRRAADAADAHKARVDAGRKSAITRKMNAKAKG